MANGVSAKKKKRPLHRHGRVGITVSDLVGGHICVLSHADEERCWLFIDNRSEWWSGGALINVTQAKRVAQALQRFTDGA